MHGQEGQGPLIRLRLVCGGMGGGVGCFVVCGWCMGGVRWWLCGVMWWLSGVMWWVSGVWVKPPPWPDPRLSNFGSGVCFVYSRLSNLSAIWQLSPLPVTGLQI
jgi:hypothetical protein